MKLLKILVLEDNPGDVFLLKRELEKAGMLFSLYVADSKETYIEGLKTFGPDIILSDHSLPSFDSMEALDIVKKSNIDIPFILVTGTVSEEFAVECMKAGVSDYIIKDSLTRLPSAIENIFNSQEIKREKESIELLHKELKNAYQEIAEKNKSITDSINYAKRMQDAILPDSERLSKFFPEWFIHYKPKDIVSGDFYWFEERNNKLIIAVADCTGHGVPGALMSVIGVELLNKIVNEKNITLPSEILRQLDMGIALCFKQKENITTSTDGMDMAICTINFDTNEMIYAGAQRPLWLIRENTLEEIKPTKFPIGGLFSGGKRSYENHRIKINPNDLVYFFTDGITDQFGGEFEKKLMTKKLKMLLLSMQSNNLNEQQHIFNDYMTKWAGNLEQVDDMLIMGLRFNNAGNTRFKMKARQDQQVALFESHA